MFKNLKAIGISFLIGVAGVVYGQADHSLEVPAEAKPLSSTFVRDIFDQKKYAIVRVICVSNNKEEVNENSTSGGIILAGSGFFVSKEGYVLTAASIVKNFRMVWVDYLGSSYTAECVGIDEQTNIALLKLSQVPTTFSYVDVTLDDERTIPEIGSLLVFVGCRFGFDPFPDMALVNGKNISYSENTFLTTYLRTNFVLCGGESGAPMFLTDGQFAGVVIASLPEINSSFILPGRAVKKIYNDLRSKGTVDHVELGIEVRSDVRFGGDQSIVITKVLSQSEAEKAGLKVGDVLKRIGNFPIIFREDLYNALFFSHYGDVMEVVIEREGAERTFKILAERKVN